MSLRVLVADDQSMVRAGFRMLLSNEEDIDVVAEASNGLEAIEKTARFQPTLVLMDIRLPEMNGVDATRVLTGRSPDTVVVLVSTYPPEDLPWDVGGCGAAGYLRKEDLSPQALQEFWERHAPTSAR